MSDFIAVHGYRSLFRHRGLTFSAYSIHPHPYPCLLYSRVLAKRAGVCIAIYRCRKTFKGRIYRSLLFPFLSFPSLPFPIFFLSFPFLYIQSPSPIIPSLISSIPSLPFLPSPISVSLFNGDRGFMKRPENFSTLQIT
jgi:hypothetical protein